MSPSGDRIFVTNYTHHKVLTLARDGTILCTCTDPDLQSPNGIHVTAQEQVLVCGADSNTILQLDVEGRKKLATLATRRDNTYHTVILIQQEHSLNICGTIRFQENPGDRFNKHRSTHLRYDTFSKIHTC
ncbi:hypothetical protein DPMN_046042 [Dreissena polymorpha]|uniref:Uncharacterized protein n=1 Tax=Dreissena polymorpha TaxID=45954 RepID=A0A9D4HXV6_DREPO|nr:hypothetical protein DPMN_046042 [Dreissena polymorpha]